MKPKSISHSRVTRRPLLGDKTASHNMIELIFLKWLIKRGHVGGINLQRKDFVLHETGDPHFVLARDPLPIEVYTAADAAVADDHHHHLRAAEQLYY